jgi:hypothetical protein
VTAIELRDWLGIIGAILGLSGFAFGLLQYLVAQRWKKSEFAAGQLDLLFKDPDLAMACTMLDWSARPLPVPEKYTVLTAEPYFHHNWDNLVRALPPEERRGSFEWPLVVYRDVFDRFFTYLERVELSISIGLIRKQDVAVLEYWLKQLDAPRFVSSQRTVFQDFILRYGYTDVPKLMRRFGLALDWPHEQPFVP